MTDLPYLLKYKNSLFPIDSDLNHDFPIKNQKPVKTLVDICCSYVVRDSGCLQKMLPMLPISTYWNLMTAALENCQTLVIDILISNWPFRILSLRKLAPSLLNDTRIFYDSVFVKDRMFIATNYTTCMAHTFVECLKNKSPTKLRVLDLTGFPTAEVIVSYIASHMLLIYNEKRQHSIINMYNELTTSQNSTDLYPIFHPSDGTFESNQFMIRLDPCINSRNTELCKALYTSKLESDLFTIQVERLDLSEMGIARICVLLEQINVDDLKGLAVKYNAITNGELQHLLNLLTSFRFLTSLDLGCNNLNLSLSPYAEQLSTALHLLPELTRLDLSNCRVTHGLRILLSQLQKPLFYLNLSGCCLRVDDISYLSSYTHVQTLTHLDISENFIGNYFQRFLSLIKVLHRNLVILEIEHCGLSEEHQNLIYTYLPLFKCLRYINICRNTPLSSETLGASGYLGNFLITKTLDVVKISIPGDIASPDNPSHFNDEVKHFLRKINGLVFAFCLRNNRHLLTIDLI